MSSSHPPGDLAMRVVPSRRISAKLRGEIISLCSRAYEEDMELLFETFAVESHILGYYDGRLVSHALWVTRYLQEGTNPIMRTAYIEAVATDEPYRNRGFAKSILNHLIGEIQDYDLAALSPFRVEYYRRLGWELWRGPRFVRTSEQLLASPADEEVMIFRLPKTPALDLSAPLSAEWRTGELW